MKVKDFSKHAIIPLITIEENGNLAKAVDKLVEYNIGALPVCDAEGVLVGIISERDLLKTIHVKKEKAEEIKIKDIMTKEVAVCTPEDDLDYVTSLMTTRNIRHIPVVVGSKPQGMISMRDIMENSLSECLLEVDNLHKYISGSCL